MQKVIQLTVTCLGLLFFTGLASVVNSQEKITYTPHWMPQAQFVGYYVAEDQGFYKEAGLDVTIVHPSPTENVADLLVRGEADIISMFLISSIESRENGIDIVNFGQLSQNCAELFVTKKTSGIESPEDFDGKKIGIWEAGFEEIPISFIKKYNCDVEWIPIVSTVNLFLFDGVDAMTVMWYNEYDRIIDSGINHDELNTFFFSDYGYNIPEDGLYCMSEVYEKRSVPFHKFLQATLKGWDYAFANKEYALEILMKRMKKANIPTNLAHQSWMLDKTEELFQLKDKPVKKGELYEKDYLNAFHVLKDIGRIKERQPDFQSFYKGGEK